jgi:PKD domain-containing protein
MLFVLNAAGVPSVASFVKLSTAIANQPPTATIVSPATNVTVNPGQSVSFSGSGSDPDGSIAAYAWTFPGGNPGSSAVAAPGNVTFSTPGTYAASFRVTDNGGATSPAATRTITVPDFSLSATPSSQTVQPGAGTSYTATVAGGTGFSGIVTFSVSGLPSGATASFNPGSVTASGSTTLSVSTSAATPPGSYALTIRGASGPAAHTVNVTLVVGGDFSIAVAPASRTITRGGTATYTVTMTAGPGFSGTVNLSVTGAPPRSTASFSPASIVNSGTSVLTVATQPNVQKRTRTLTITGTSGTRVHSTTVTLIIQ